MDDETRQTNVDSQQTMTHGYTIQATPDGMFNIAVAGHDGINQTVIGFPDEEAANLWIEQDMRLNPIITTGQNWRLDRASNLND